MLKRIWGLVAARLGQTERSQNDRQSMPGTAEFREAYPTEEELNVEPGYNRVLAKAQQQILDEIRKTSSEISTALTKWIITSLLAINAGGAIAIGQLKISATCQLIGGASFVVGLILPMVIALISASSADRYGRPVGSASEYWRQVEYFGLRDREEEMRTFDFLAEVRRNKRWPRRLGLASTMLFVLGCSIVGYGLITALPQPPSP